ISVEEKLELFEDLDFAGGKIDFPGPVTIHKNVLDSVELAAAGDITVDGSIEAANVTCSKNLLVHHGICGKERGRIVVHGNIHARFASNSNLDAAGDIHMDNEVGNSRIV